MKAQDVLNFWFEELTPEQHFKKDIQLDMEIKRRFYDCHQRIVAGEMDAWRETIQGRLAEIIVLDQFSRNMFRGTKNSFAYDNLALFLAQEALKTSDLNILTIDQTAFLLMPFMHSESKKIHQTALHLFNRPGMETYFDFEKRHADIIEEFGRYPHRNEILGRESTAEETAFLQQPNSSF